MTMTTTQAVITIVAVVLGTMATRFISFMIFPEGKNPPEICTISWNSTSICRNRTSHYLLSQRCPVEQYTWAS